MTRARHGDPRARAGCSNCGARHCGTRRPAVTARRPEIAVTAHLHQRGTAAYGSLAATLNLSWREGIRPASCMAAGTLPRTCRTCDQTVWGSRADETTPEGCTIVALYEIRDPNFRVLYRQAGLMPTGPQATDAIAPRGVSHRKMMTMRLPYLRRNRAWLRRTTGSPGTPRAQ